MATADADTHILPRVRDPRPVVRDGNRNSCPPKLRVNAGVSTEDERVLDQLRYVVTEILAESGPWIERVMTAERIPPPIEAAEIVCLPSEKDPVLDLERVQLLRHIYPAPALLSSSYFRFR